MYKLIVGSETFMSLHRSVLYFFLKCFLVGVRLYFGVRMKEPDDAG